MINIEHLEVLSWLSSVNLNLTYRHESLLVGIQAFFFITTNINFRLIKSNEFLLKKLIVN